MLKKLLLPLFVMLCGSAALAVEVEAAPGWSVLLIPAVVLICILAVIVAVALFLRNYIKVPPNQVAVISGRRHRLADDSVAGFRVIHGGATFRWPVIERVDYLDLNVMSVPTKTANVITKQGVPLSVEAIANVKIGSADMSLRAAAERFLSKPHSEIMEIISQTLEAHLRAICCTMTVEQINNDRQTFAHQMIQEAAEDLRKMGIVIDVWAVQHIQDEHGYLESLGKTQTANVKRDAVIGEAEASRDSQIRTAEAQRDAVKRATDAQREGEVAKNSNLQQIAEAERDLRVKQAKFSAEVAAEEARRDQARPLADAEAKKQVFVAQVNAEKAKIEAEIELQERTSSRKQKELEVTVIREAEANQRKWIIEADAYKQSTVLRAGGDRDAAIAKATASKEVGLLEGEGEAARIKAVKFAEAEGDAAIVSKRGLAEAEAIKAKLLAEAEGLHKKAEAYKALDEAAKLQFILEKAPGLIEALGVAAAQALTPVFDSVGKGLANIDKVVIVDTGGANGGSGLGKFATTGPTMIFQMLQQARLLGLDPTGLLKKLGVAVVQEVGVTSADAPTTTSAPAPAPALPQAVAKKPKE